MADLLNILVAFHGLDGIDRSLPYTCNLLGHQCDFSHKRCSCCDSAPMTNGPSDNTSASWGVLGSAKAYHGQLASVQLRCESIRLPFIFEKKQLVYLVLCRTEAAQVPSNVAPDFDSLRGLTNALAEARFTVGSLVSSRTGELAVELRPAGVVRISLSVPRSPPETNVNGFLRSLQFRGTNIKNLPGSYGTASPRFVLLSSCGTTVGSRDKDVGPSSGQLKVLHESEVVEDDVNPLWRSLPTLSTMAVCGGDLNARTLTFVCYDNDAAESDDEDGYVGEFVCSANELVAPNAQHALINLRSKGFDLGGVISLAEGTLSIMPNFLDLLKKGLQLNIAFAIDFTGSNLEVTNPRSLHYHHPTQPNQYIQAMIAVSDVVQEYDSDKQFAAFGFGAVLPGEHAANHFFHLSLGPNPYLPGMQAVINTYVQTSQVVRFYGPTNFAPTISSVANGARGAAGVYTILLILTDGEITDLNDTIDEIVKADDAPLSILIVGVGQACFDSMSALDSDKGGLKSSTGRVARRDLVQFVAMRDFANRSAADVAAELLAEIPDQVGKWAEMNPAAVAAFAAAAGAQRPAVAGTNV